MAKKRKRGKSASEQPQSQPKGEALPTEKYPTKGEIPPSQSKAGTTKKKAVQNQSTPLWDLTMIEDATPPARIASPALSSEPPEQLTLF